MSVWIVWRASPLLPGVRSVELVTASKKRALALAAGSALLVAERVDVEDTG